MSESDAAFFARARAEAERRLKKELFELEVSEARMDLIEREGLEDVPLVRSKEGVRDLFRRVRSLEKRLEKLEQLGAVAGNERA